MKSKNRVSPLEAAWSGSITYWSLRWKPPNHIRFVSCLYFHNFDEPHQVRLYSRDMELTSQNILHREILPAPVVILSIVDNSLLVYTADNTLHHYLIVPTAESIKLHLCGSLTFTGVISAPGSVRMLSWMIPTVQKRK